MSYVFLSAPLHPIAAAARRFMHTEWGIADGKILAEKPIDGDIVPSPTLQAPNRDHHLVCIEVSERAYRPHLDSVVVSCMTRGLPVMLYVALREADLRTEDLKRAKERGIGVLLFSSELQIFNPALSLSLLGVRHPEPKSWPAKYRHRIFAAHQTFVNGDPSKGCSLLYEIIEDVTRRVHVKAARRGWWRNLPTGTVVPNAANRKIPLQKISKFLYDYFDPGAAHTPSLENVFGTVVGVVSPRNDDAHPPKNPKALQKRALRARTRFENATDVLRDLVEGAGPLRI